MSTRPNFDDLSISLLFALCLVSVCARYYIRIAIQKQFALDDAFLALGTACLTAAMVLLYINMDDMYFIEAVTYASERFDRLPGPQDVNRYFSFRQCVTASLILTYDTFEPLP
ncbi:MAG: hypothetical protein LQ346_001623 [Caloplaca aetnensis]|nr:MAG: hypothetical protein LQ346_001623 [Caloplaca aetnensis]